MSQINPIDNIKQATCWSPFFYLQFPVSSVWDPSVRVCGHADQIGHNLNRMDQTLLKEKEKIFIPITYLPAILTTLHFRLMHPSAFQIQQVFNKYFASIASNLNQAHSDDNPNSNSTPSFTDYLPKSTTSSVFLHDCDVAEITEIINELRNGKSSDIPIHVVKNSCQVIAPYLVN